MSSGFAHYSPERYMAAIFLSAEDLVANTQNVGRLIGIFGPLLDEEQLFPTTVREATPAGARPRIGFTSADGSKALALLGSRFDYVEQSQNPNGEDMVGLREFAVRAARVLGTILEGLGKKAHRLALVRNGHIIDADHDAMGRRLLALPRVYQGSPLNEWDWRVNGVVERGFGEFREATNTITAIRYAPGQIIEIANGVLTQSKEVHQPRLEIDINTLASSTALRFSGVDLAEFFHEAVSWHDEVAASLLATALEGAE